MELFAVGGPFLAIGACIGFVLGWVACRGIVDLERMENADTDEDQADVLPFPPLPGA